MLVRSRLSDLSSHYYTSGIPRFYDIGGFLAEPEVFQRIVDIFVARYAEIGIDSVAGLDARGFILGPPVSSQRRQLLMWWPVRRVPRVLSCELTSCDLCAAQIALALKKPFIMMRKEGKMPNTISSSAYNTEYGKRAGLTVQKDRIKKGGEEKALPIRDFAIGCTWKLSILTT